MTIWRDLRRDMGMELLLFAYVITWAVVLLVTVMLTK